MCPAAPSPRREPARPWGLQMTRLPAAQDADSSNARPNSPPWTKRWTSSPASGRTTSTRPSGRAARCSPSPAAPASARPRLLAEVRRRAAAKGCTVLSARGGDQEQSVAFHVARQLLQPQLAGIPEAELRASLGSWYAIVGPALGLCAAADGRPARPAGPARRPRLGAHPPRRAARPDGPASSTTRTGPTPSHCSWLAAFAPRAERTAPAARRRLPARRTPRPRRAVPRPARPGRTTPPRPGTADRGRRRPIWYARPSATQADDAFCRECWAVTAGNPFEAVELTAKVRDRGLAPTEAGAHLLRDLAAAVKGSGLVARLERLGTSTVRFAWACAVLGTEIPPTLAAAVAGLGTRGGRRRGGRAARRPYPHRRRDRHPGIRPPAHRHRRLPGHSRRRARRPARPGRLVRRRRRARPVRRRPPPHGDPPRRRPLGGPATARGRRRDPARRRPGRRPPPPRPRPARTPAPSRNGPPSCTNSAAPPCSPSPPPPSTTCGPHSKSPSPTRPCGTTSSTASPRSSPTATASARPPTPSPARPAADRRRPRPAAHAVRAVHVGRLPRRRARLPGPLPAAGPARRPPDRPRPHRAVHHRAARLGRHPARRTRRTSRSTTPNAPWPAASSWADEDRGFEVPVLVALAFMYADRPGRAEELFAAGIGGVRAAGLARRPSVLRLHPARRTSATGADGSPRPRTSSGPDCGSPSASGRRTPAALVRRRHPHRDPAGPRPAPTKRSDRRTGPRLRRALPRRRRLPRLPDRVRRTAAGPGPHQGGGRRTRRRRAAGSTRAACATPPGAPGSSISPSPRPTTHRRGRGPSPSTPSSAPAASAPPPASVRHCGSPPRCPTAASRTAFLREAVTCLERSPAAYELARALVGLGAASAPHRPPEGGRGVSLPRTGGRRSVRRRRARGHRARRARRRGAAPPTAARQETDALTTRERTAALLTVKGETRPLWRPPCTSTNPP